MLQPIMFQAGTPCLCFNRNGSVCWRSSSPKEGAHLRCCPPKGHPCFPQPGPTAPDGQAGSRGEQRGDPACPACSTSVSGWVLLHSAGTQRQQNLDVLQNPGHSSGFLKVQLCAGKVRNS